MTKRRIHAEPRRSWTRAEDMAKALSMPLKNRLARKAIPTGCGSAWWYLNQNGDITIYGSEPTFSCTIKRRALRVVSRASTSSHS